MRTGPYRASCSNSGLDSSLSDGAGWNASNSRTSLAPWNAAARRRHHGVHLLRHALAWRLHHHLLTLIWRVTGCHGMTLWHAVRCHGRRVRREGLCHAHRCGSSGVSPERCGGVRIKN